MIFINCGGTEDLVDLLDLNTEEGSTPVLLLLQLPPIICPALPTCFVNLKGSCQTDRPRCPRAPASSGNQRALVIDSHRPIHTKNSAAENGQVIVLVSENEEQPPTDLGDMDGSSSDGKGRDGREGARCRGP